MELCNVKILSFTYRVELERNTVIDVVRSLLPQCRQSNDLLLAIDNVVCGLLFERRLGSGNVLIDNRELIVRRG